MKEIKIRNVSKKKHAKTQKKRQKEEIKQKQEIRRVKRLERVKDEKKQENNIHKKPIENIESDEKTMKYIKESINDNLSYLYSYIANNEPLKMNRIFDNDLNILDEQKIDISLLKELADMFTLANGFEYPPKTIKNNIYNYINTAIKDEELLKVKDEFKKNINKSEFIESFALNAIKYLYKIFENIVINMYKLNNNISIFDLDSKPERFNYKYIIVPIWMTNFYMYCQKSYVMKFNKRKSNLERTNL